jgi:hypothetical protein
MRRYRFLKGLALGLVLGISGATIHHWDAGAGPSPGVKYRLGDKPDLGIIVHHPMPPGPRLREFQCIGSEKDCGAQPVVHSVPVPGTLWLIGVGLLWLWRFKPGAKPPRSRLR